MRTYDNSPKRNGKSTLKKFCRKTIFKKILKPIRFPKIKSNRQALKMFAVMYKLKAIKENLKSTALKPVNISAMLIFLKRKTKTTIEIRPKKIIFLNLFIFLKPLYWLLGFFNGINKNLCEFLQRK